MFTKRFHAYANIPVSPTWFGIGLDMDWNNGHPEVYFTTEQFYQKYKSDGSRVPSFRVEEFMNIPKGMFEEIDDNTFVYSGKDCKEMIFRLEELGCIHQPVLYGVEKGNPSLIANLATEYWKCPPRKSSPPFTI